MLSLVAIEDNLAKVNSPNYSNVNTMGASPNTGTDAALQPSVTPLDISGLKFVEFYPTDAPQTTTDDDRSVMPHEFPTTTRDPSVKNSARFSIVKTLQ